MIFRQSLISTWLGCPLQAKFKEIDLLPRRQSGKATFGTVMHHCLEKFNKGLPLDETVALFYHLWENPEVLNAAPDYWPRMITYGGLREKGPEILRLYAEKVKWENRTVIAGEHSFLVPFGDDFLQGTVDHIEFRKAGNGHPTLRVVDFKTNSKQPNVMELKFNIQFTTYIYASLQPEFWLGSEAFPGVLDGEKWFEKLEKVPRRGVWYALMSNKEFDAGKRDDGDFMRLYRACQEIKRAIDKEVYVPDISADTCLWCDYTSNCGIEIPSREELLDEVG